LKISYLLMMSLIFPGCGKFSFQNSDADPSLGQRARVIIRAHFDPPASTQILNLTHVKAKRRLARRKSRVHTLNSSESKQHIIMSVFVQYFSQMACHDHGFLWDQSLFAASKCCRAATQN
jgi:hypothetical protein